MTSSSDARVRLQKVIAASGLCSRRAAEDFIRRGQVTVNGRIVTTVGTCINPTVDHVKVQGRHLEKAEPEVFVLLHKPAGCVTTMQDPLGRKTIADFLNKIKVRVFPVGRLDYDAEGLLLLTNNGRVGHVCLHPRFHVPKTYMVKVSGVLTEEEIRLLQRGVKLEDGVTAPAGIKKAGKTKANSWLEVTISEGKKHQVKRMIEACGHRVIRLKRIRFGPLQLGDLPPGGVRYASDAEANALRHILRSQAKLTGNMPGIQPPGSLKKETESEVVLAPRRNRKGIPPPGAKRPIKKGKLRASLSMVPNRTMKRDHPNSARFLKENKPKRNMMQTKKVRVS